MIHKEAVGCAEILLHARVKVGNHMRVMLALDVLRDRLHGAWAEERHHRVDIVDSGGFELFKVARHACAVKLEGALGFAAREHLKCFSIIERHVFDINSDTAGFLYQLN